MLLLFWWMVGLSSWAVDVAPCSDVPPPGWVSLSDPASGVRVDARYASANNFTGAPLPGYQRADAWLREEAAGPLKAAAASLKDQGFGLVVYDAYRPVRATEEMVAWTVRTNQSNLVTDGYIASRSGHNHGHTIDLSLVGLDGAPVDMGSPYDHFGVESHHGAAVGAEASALRERLRTAMEQAGFVAYSKEWWHYRFPLKGTVPQNVAIGCSTAPSGSQHGDIPATGAAEEKR